MGGHHEPTESDEEGSDNYIAQLIVPCQDPFAGLFCNEVQCARTCSIKK